MELKSFTVENFRSITTARQIQVGSITTLIGPNNEGKSNILRALAIAVNSLVQLRGSPAFYTRDGRRIYVRPSRRNDAHYYDWESDYPLAKQRKNKEGGSIVTLEFSLDEQETRQFKAEVGSNLNGRLPIQLLFKRNSEVERIIPKRGPGQAILTKKTAKIAEFLSKRIDVQYIPAVRTSEAAIDVVNSLVARELSLVEEDPKYVQAMADIEALQTPLLQSLSRGIERTMKTFIPALSEVKIDIERRDRSVALRSASTITIDDGVATSLKQKGEGVQSLAALAIMRHASDASNKQKNVIIALEEPESHLHPSAIHQLRLVINELASRHQVVLTTHNPLFVNCLDISSNIIVNKNRAAPATSVADVRRVLGVRLSDNLQSADLVLIVEGDEDRVALEALLSTRSQPLASAIASRRLAIDALGGAGNLTHRCRMYQDSFCKVHAFLDDDSAARTAYSRAEKEGVLSAVDINFASWGSSGETEMEDLYIEDLWNEVLGEAFSLHLSHPDAKGKKWSDRVRRALKAAGRIADDPQIQMLKSRLAAKAAAVGWSAIHEKKRGPIENLAIALENKLSDNNASAESA